MSVPIPAVSVVMPVWRPHPVYFGEALASVLRQTLADFELIVVEDPSERSAEAAIRDAADPRIRYFANPSRTSIVEQHNRGVALARGNLIARFDADDVCEPDRLRFQREFLESHPGIGVVGCQLMIIDSSGRILGERRYPCLPDEIRRSFRRSNPMANPGVMFRRGVVAEHGGWTQGSNGVARDYEWFSRLATRGVMFANVDERLVRYRLNDASLKRTKMRATLKTTYEVKRDYWWSEMSVADRAVMMAERSLGLFPPALVMRLFRLTRIRTLGGADGKYPA